MGGPTRDNSVMSLPPSPPTHRQKSCSYGVFLYLVKHWNPHIAISAPAGHVMWWQLLTSHFAIGFSPSQPPAFWMRTPCVPASRRNEVNSRHKITPSGNGGLHLWRHIQRSYLLKLALPLDTFRHMVGSRGIPSHDVRWPDPLREDHCII